MLLELYVRNFALIDEAAIEFAPGLNILTGETGAGKSMIIDAAGAAMGGRARSNPIKDGADRAVVELTASCGSERTRQALNDAGIMEEDGCIVISRIFTPQRGAHRINGQTAASATVRRVCGTLFDICGQNEHAALCRNDRQLGIIDRYGGGTLSPMLEEAADAYAALRAAQERLAHFSDDESALVREKDLLEFEVAEIESANMKDGELEALVAEHRRLSNAEALKAELLKAAGEISQNAADSVSRALRHVMEAARIDGGIDDIAQTLMPAEEQLQDALGAILRYTEGLSDDPMALREAEARMDTLTNLERKYGKGYESIQEALSKRRTRLVEIQNYDSLKARAKRGLESAKSRMSEICARLTASRKEVAAPLSKKIRDALLKLNFLNNGFECAFSKKGDFTAAGCDDVEFLISTNPGQPLTPLAKTASGGELSRIMLAVRTILADRDDVPTVIFDEIDAGISGRTAQRVSEKLAELARYRQVICITHLPQIAAMADRHFKISKEAEGGKTVTRVEVLDSGQSVAELARMLGGTKITEAVHSNAAEMRRLALEFKEGIC